MDAITELMLTHSALKAEIDNFRGEVAQVILNCDEHIAQCEDRDHIIYMNGARKTAEVFLQRMELLP